MRQLPLIAFGLWTLLGAAAPPLSFRAAEAHFAGAAAEYRRIWDGEGARIAAALEAATGLSPPGRSR